MLRVASLGGHESTVYRSTFHHQLDCHHSVVDSGGSLWVVSISKGREFYQDIRIANWR